MLWRRKRRDDDIEGELKTYLTLLAAFDPARCASNVDPVVALSNAKLAGLRQ
jgi:hypothetical protein